MTMADGDFRCRWLPALGLHGLYSVDGLLVAIGPRPIRAFSLAFSCCTPVAALVLPCSACNCGGGSMHSAWTALRGCDPCRLGNAVPGVPRFSTSSFVVVTIEFFST
eukprot:TRINITY_DN9264_c0_g1_i3.p4 TRINITY_DN9264_c0_g1~~TRINITY_DN9264_c0_g1_i3.p4  ORF type:complete len:107 (-),score=2.93 TRINITY_DN9264_c0_g1_i3:684-1004(-)